MSDVIIVCPPEAANGFRLAGMIVKCAHNASETWNIVKDLRLKMKSGIVILPEHFVLQFSKRDQQDLKSQNAPNFVSIPLEWKKKEDLKQEFIEIVKNIIGFKIALTSQVFKSEALPSPRRGKKIQDNNR